MRDERANMHFILSNHWQMKEDIYRHVIYSKICRQEKKKSFDKKNKKSWKGFLRDYSFILNISKLQVFYFRRLTRVFKEILGKLDNRLLSAASGIEPKIFRLRSTNILQWATSILKKKSSKYVIVVPVSILVWSM